MNTAQLERSAAVADALAYRPPVRAVPELPEPDAIIITRASDLRIEPVAWL